MTSAKVILGRVDYGMTGLVRNHSVTIDEPIGNGGKDTGPAPSEYLCIALAACTTATMKMYANRKEWNIEGLVVEVEKDVTTDGKNVFKRTIHLTGTLENEQRERLLQIANVCPVHKVLSQGNVIETAYGN
jgi:putative redox protein